MCWLKSNQSNEKPLFVGSAGGYPSAYPHTYPQHVWMRREYCAVTCTGAGHASSAAGMAVALVNCWSGKETGLQRIAAAAVGDSPGRAHHPAARCVRLVRLDAADTVQAVHVGHAQRGQDEGQVYDHVPHQLVIADVLNRHEGLEQVD